MTVTRTRLSGADIGIIALTIATAAIHFSRALADPEIRALFILNGLGYLALLAALYMPLPIVRERPTLVRRVLIGYAALTILLWAVWSIMSGEVTALGVVDKLIEVALIGLLWRKGRQV
jgi:hypothetical protein